jgi:tetratricopeptide (TPR) repeat protein
MSSSAADGLSSALPHSLGRLKAAPTFVLALLIALAPSAALAQSRWSMVRSQTLTVMGDQSADLLKDIASRLEQFRLVVGGAFRGAGGVPSLPTVVYVFGSRASMSPHLPIVNGKPLGVAGFMSRDGDVNRIVISADVLEESARVAYHEYTHLLVNNVTRALPLWLNEGLADYYSTFVPQDEGKAADIGRPVQDYVAVARRRWMPLDQVIVTQSIATHDQDRRNMFYAESWLLVHYLLTEVPNGLASINVYANKAAEGLQPAEAFLEAFGATPVAFDAKLRDYAKKPAFKLRRVPIDEKGAAAREIAGPKRLSAAESEAWLGDLQRSAQRVQEAAPRIEKAVKDEPNLAIGHLALARLRMAQKRTDEGIAAFSRAAELAPDDFMTLYSSASWQLRTGTAVKPGVVSPVLATLRRATTIRDDSADAQALHAYVALASNELLEARTAIDRAVELAPTRLDYRLRQAEVLMQQGYLPQAKAILNALAAVKTDPSIVRLARQRLEMIAKREQQRR